MELRDYLKVVYKWLWFIVLTTLIAGMAGYLVLWHLALLPAYRATATVMISGSSADLTRLEIGQALAPTYAELAKREPFAQSVVESLGLPISAEKLKEHIEANPIPGTQLIEIVATYNDPQQAAAIANQVARQLVEQAPAGLRRDFVITEAQPPLRPSLGTYGNVLAAAFTGLLLATGAVFLIEYLDDSIRTAEEVRRHLHLPTLGIVKDASSRHFWWTLAEACWRQCSKGTPSTKSILVTSPGPSEGKSTIAINLAITWAKAGRKTLLVDAHLRHPVVHQRLGLPNEGGLVDLLQQSGPINSQTLPSARTPNLKVLTSGPRPSDPPELLASQRMDEVLNKLVEDVDAVILDGPPVLSADAAILASKVDGILLVLDQSGTKRAASEAVETLRMVGGKILGVILNEG